MTGNLPIFGQFNGTRLRRSLGNMYLRQHNGIGHKPIPEVYANT
jgi:hypothetical protein